MYNESTARGDQMQEMLQDLLNKLNERMRTDEKLQKEMEGIERTIMIEVTDGDSYFTKLKELHTDELQVGRIDKPDILISANEKTLRGLINKEISPIKAFLVTKQLKLEASLEDKLRLRKFFE